MTTIAFKLNHQLPIIYQCRSSVLVPGIIALFLVLVDSEVRGTLLSRPTKQCVCTILASYQYPQLELYWILVRRFLDLQRLSNVVGIMLRAPQNVHRLLWLHDHLEANKEIKLWEDCGKQDVSLMTEIDHSFVDNIKVSNW